MDAGILAVKRLDQAKQRLGSGFTPVERAEVARALLEDAFALCALSDGVRWWVVSDSSSVLQEATERGFQAVHDAGEGLNPALVRAVDAVLAGGADSVTVIPADIPLTRPGDIEVILETGATSEIVIVPAGDGGTNALYLTPPGLIEPLFGPRSLQAHLSAAEQGRLRCSVLPLERMALDIDTPEDIECLLAEAGSEQLSRAVRLLTRLRPPTAAET